jgi:aldose 1-epimerase
LIQEEKFETEAVFKLENDQIELWIAPTVGANLYKIFLKDSKQSILRSPQSLEDFKQNSIYYGIPVLIPPNRIRNATFKFNNQLFNFPVNTDQGHHIHGLSLGRKWRFLSLEDNPDYSSITFSFDVIDHEDLFSIFPFKLQFEYTIKLLQSSIETNLVIKNLDKIAIPVGAGFHTWFNLLGGSNKWHLQLPFEKVWELDEESFPTGNLLKSDQIDLLRSGINLEGKNFDTVFLRGNNPSEATLIREDGFSLTYTTSNEFKHWVVHTPTDVKDCISIEPYSWVTDAPNLNLSNSLTGLICLEPMQSHSFLARLQIG